MRCPACGHMEDRVIDSRSVKDGAGVRRRRECLKCERRFTTYEGVIPEELRVVKRNGEREEFDRDKLRRGIANACYKRPVSPEEIDRAVENISAGLQRDFEKEIMSSEIGDRVMNELKGLDQVAYVRFASVYRKFKAVEEFLEEIRRLND